MVILFKNLIHRNVNLIFISKPGIPLSVGSAKVTQVKAASNAPKALIIEPSKELAEQTLNVVKQFRKYVDNPKLRFDWQKQKSKPDCAVALK